LSRATDLAEREAAEAEAESPDDTPGLEPSEEEEAAEEEETPTPEPEPVTEARIKKISAAISKEDDRHEAAMRRILGDLWEGREVCPLCMQEGFVIPAQPGEFDQEQRYAVLAAMGDLSQPKLKAHPYFKRCPDCDGWGKLETFSRKEEYATENCDTCQGFGRIDTRTGATNVLSFTPAPANVTWNPPAPPPSVETPNADVWGRPWGHKDWGQNPAEVNAG